MDSIKENIDIQQQYKEGFEISKIKEDALSSDITSEQWFWDMAVIS